MMLRLVLVAAALLCVGQLAVAEEGFPTLLESTALSTGKFAPTPRTRLEKMQLTARAQAQQSSLVTAQDRTAYFPDDDDMKGHAADSAANQRENAGRSREPLSPYFDYSPKKGNKRAPKAPKAPAAAKNLWGTPPPAELPLASPPTPSCSDLNCAGPVDNDPTLVRVPAPPLGDLALGYAGEESPAMKAIVAKIRNRQGWLSAQKAWLVKAMEAAQTVRREIEMAQTSKAMAASDLEQLAKAQDMLSLRLKAHQLKWSFKDKKFTLENMNEKLEDLHNAKADVAHQLAEASMEVKVLRNTLGPASEQEQISPKDLEDPLKFLEDLEREEAFTP